MKLPKEEILQIFKETDALLDGHFLLTSGLHSPHYFQCAKVLQYPKYLHLFSGEIAKHFEYSEIDLVISPAIGGIVVGTEVGRMLEARTIFAERKRRYELAPRIWNKERRTGPRGRRRCNDRRLGKRNYSAC